MWDPQTNSQWSHILGRAMAGPLRGTDLKPIPAVIMDWETFATTHPDGSLLWMSRTAKQFRREFYRKPEEFVLGITIEGKSWAWGWDTMMKTPVRNVTLGNVEAVVVFDQPSTSAQIYSRSLGEEKLTFQFDGKQMTDKATGSTWSRISGLCTEGKHKGKQLRALPSIPSFRHTWKAFHPESKFQ